MLSESSQEYRTRAEECERLLKLAVNREVRAVLLYLAARWWAFSEEANRRDETTPRTTSASFGIGGLRDVPKGGGAAREARYC